MAYQKSTNQLCLSVLLFRLLIRPRPTNNLSKFLSRILSGLVKNNYSVRNSREFVKYVKNCHVQKKGIFESFDVVSLFTSVPVDKAFDFVLELLSSDDALPSRTSLSISDIKQGLKICWDSTLFSYKDSFYKQTFGTTMGSCISPIIANIYMEHIEHIAITTFHTPPSLWLRYVDDTFCILDKEHVTARLGQLDNSSFLITLIRAKCR